MYEHGALALTRASLLVLMISIGEMLCSFEKKKKKRKRFKVHLTRPASPCYIKGKSLSEVECLLQVIQ